MNKMYIRQTWSGVKWVFFLVVSFMYFFFNYLLDKVSIFMW